MTSLTPALDAFGEPVEGSTPHRSLSARLAIAFIALVTAWMVGGVRATPAFADDDGWGDKRTSGEHRDGDRTARSGDWSSHDGDARSGDRQRSEWRQRAEAAKRLAAKRAAAKAAAAKAAAAHVKSVKTHATAAKPVAVSHAKSKVV